MATTAQLLRTATRGVAAAVWLLCACLLVHFYFPFLAIHHVIQPLAIQACHQFEGCSAVSTTQRYDKAEKHYFAYILIYPEKPTSARERTELLDAIRAAYQERAQQANFIVRSLALRSVIEGARK